MTDKCPTCGHWNCPHQQPAPAPEAERLVQMVNCSQLGWPSEKEPAEVIAGIRALAAERDEAHKKCREFAEVAIGNGQGLILAEAENERLREKLSDIADVCIGYDGFDTVEGLKGLIDDIAGMARAAPEGIENQGAGERGDSPDRQSAPCDDPAPDFHYDPRAARALYQKMYGCGRPGCTFTFEHVHREVE